MSQADSAQPKPVVKRRPLLRLLLALVLLGAFLAAIVALNRMQAGAWLFQRAERLSAPVLAAPEAAAPEEADRAIERFRRVVKFAKGTTWEIGALNRIGRLALAQRRYVQAREAFEPICSMRGSSPEMCMMSRIFIGRCYEADGWVDAAAQTYADMERWYPWTPLWIEAPIYSAQLYERHGLRQQATAAYQRAVTLFLDRLRGTLDPVALDALRWNLGLAYEGLEAWKEAARVFEAALTADNRGDMRQRPAMLYELGRLYEERLRQPQKARVVYEQLITEFPEHQAARQAAEALKRLADLR